LLSILSKRISKNVVSILREQILKILAFLDSFCQEFFFIDNISFDIILFVTSHDVTKKYRSQISKETSLILTPNPLGFLRYSASIFFGDVILRTTARNITSKYRDHHILTERVLNMQTKMCESIHLFGMKPPHLIILTSLPQNIYPFYNRHNYYFWATELLLCKCLQILFYLCSVVTNIY
jgi:hypothetical protein